VLKLDKPKAHTALHLTAFGFPVILC